MSSIKDEVENLQKLAENLSPLIDKMRVLLDEQPMPEIGNILEESLGSSPTFQRIMAKLDECERLVEEATNVMREVRQDIDDTAISIAQAGS